MKIVYIGTYPPRQCGIGTFTRNKFMAMTVQPGIDIGHEGIVIAINNQGNADDYPPEVRFTIRQDEQNDYIEAAEFINRSGCDICILEHEFGIFGGPNGIYILPLLHRLEIPVVAVFHTVLKTPSPNEKSILTSISKMAARVVVMTHKAVEFLSRIYGVPRGQIEIIEHGVPDLQFNQQVSKKEFNLESKKMLLTFGLIGRNKGIETVIKALPVIVAKYPEIVYVILGKTHPSVVKHSGEEYRDYLRQLVSELNLEEHVLFVNEFTDEDKLFKYLTAADIYVTPYLNEAQSTSGTLSYAVGAGCAVISTPYWHASELLPRVGGRLFDFNNHRQLSAIFMDLLDHPEALREMHMKAYAHGREITWPKIGEEYITLSKMVLERASGKPYRKLIPEPMVSLPSFSLDHIRRLTDNTGIIQHAKYGIPNYKEGYCLDDNARALLMTLMAYKKQKNTVSEELMHVYLAYIHYMQNNDGTFHNFMSFNKSFLDENGSEDSFGRAIWALGYLHGNSPNDACFRLGREIFFKAVPNFRKLKSLRGVANTLIGVCLYLQSDPQNNEMIALARHLSARLVQEYSMHRTEQWKWFEPVLTYDNAILPLSLLHAACILDDGEMMAIAGESMKFLSGITLRNGYLSVIGNEKWYAKGGRQSVFAQQPVDVMMMVLMFQKAFSVTKNRSFIKSLHTCFMWFFGENDLRMSLYDYETKGCCDGLESYGINRNQGAESTLGYLISHLAWLEVAEKTEIYGTAGNGGIPMKNNETASVYMTG